MFDTIKQKIGSLFKNESAVNSEEALSFSAPLTPALRRRMREEEQFKKYGVVKERFYTEETL